MTIYKKVLERYRQRLAKSQRGSILIEAMIFMGVLALTTTAFATSGAGAMRATKDVQTYDVASQAANGFLERAQSMAWGSLCPGTTAAQTQTIRGRTVTIRRTVTWIAPTPAPASCAAFGTKQIDIRVDYPFNGTTQTSTFTSRRTAQASEVTPTAIVSGEPVTLATVPSPTATPAGTAIAEPIPNDNPGATPTIAPTGVLPTGGPDLGPRSCSEQGRTTTRTFRSRNYFFTVSTPGWVRVCLDQIVGDIDMTLWYSDASTGGSEVRAGFSTNRSTTPESIDFYYSGSGSANFRINVYPFGANGSARLQWAFPGG